MPRRSLRTRLVILCVALVAGAVASTAAIVSLSTTASINQQYRHDIAGGAQIYNALLGYAATHPSWAGLTAAQMRKMSDGPGEITLTDTRRRVVAASDGDAAPPSDDARPAATVDALTPDPDLSRSPELGGIDARALGPFRLSDSVRTHLGYLAATAAKCLTDAGYEVAVSHYPNGRPYLTHDSGPVPAQFVSHPCAMVTFEGGNAPHPTFTTSAGWPNVYHLGVGSALTVPTAQEIKAAKQLTRLFRSCLRTAGRQLPIGYPSAEQVDFLPALLGLRLGASAETCLGTARRNQLAGYVAPPVLLFISGRVATDLRPGLSSAAIWRIVLAAVAILLIAVLAVLVAANGISRPLRTLTGAVERMRGGQKSLQVPATGTKEVTALTHAFNDMSAELAAADTRRKEMISDVAHELRTPLGNVRGWLEAVQDGLAAPDAKLIASLLDESRLLQSIIDDLQVLALADADRFVVHPEPIDLGDVLDQVTAAQRVNATAKGLRLDLVADGDLRCTADPDRLRQALGNLVSNAIRYTEHGTVTIAGDGTGRDIEVRVADTGPGISTEDLPHIFDRFWRAEKSRDRRSGGSGLGLAIADHLVRAHGGRIEVSSALGEGTTVTVHLPRQPGADGRDSAPA